MSSEFSKLFHRKIKHPFQLEKGMGPLVEPVRNSGEVANIRERTTYTEYPRMPQTKLPSPIDTQFSLIEALTDRRSDRSFSQKEVTLQEMSTILKYSCGINESYKTINARETSVNPARHYPSGGALYPIEIYLDVKALQDTQNGIYHYNVRKNSLELVGGAIFQEKYGKELYSYEWMYFAPIMLIFTIVWDRNGNKYNDVGYLLGLKEAGHIAQNVQLLCTALGLSSCPSEGFSQKHLEEYLDILPDLEAPIYTLALGKK